ncbi:MAG: DNA replication/repair protein RecF [Lachnospiraceae bacterium]|nr:DNA replication/repair protein RecF [Lachnospiraceae bacterium]
MRVKRLELLNYRNYKSLDLEFAGDTNIFYGDNAQGKTNILEAVFVACTTKSHKKSRDQEIIGFSGEEAHIRLFLEKKGIDYKIDMHLRKGRRKFAAINGVSVKKASELLGIANVVFFSPEDLNLIKSGPSERRRFMDMELCQLNRIYIDNLVKYNKCLEQRNKLLKELSFGRVSENERDTLEIWEDQLISYGIRIIEYRERFTGELKDIIRKNHSSLTGNNEYLELNYEPDVSIEDFAERLKGARKKDLKLCSTSVGPHRDDLSFFLEETDLRKYGSQGQQRTAALSLKLSELELISNTIGDSPILLLDDVLSELDEHRQGYLLDSIGGIQTLITCTGLEDFIRSRIRCNKTFRVTKGTVETVIEESI